MSYTLENYAINEECRQDLASMFGLLNVELLGDTLAIRKQLLQFMSLVAPQYDGLRERVEKELGKTVPVLRQQALEVLDKKRRRW